MGKDMREAGVPVEVLEEKGGRVENQLDSFRASAGRTEDRQRAHQWNSGIEILVVDVSKLDSFPGMTKEVVLKQRSVHRSKEEGDRKDLRRWMEKDRRWQRR